MPTILGFRSAIITRLRQACLHPTLLLKAGAKGADPSVKLVRKMVAKWLTGSGGESETEEVLEELNESDDDLQPACMLCHDVRCLGTDIARPRLNVVMLKCFTIIQTCEEPVFFPCEHSGCKDCMVAYLTEENDNTVSTHCFVTPL